MPAMSRELSITYGSFTVGGDQSAKILEGIYNGEVNYEKAVYGFTFVIRESAEADYGAAIAACEAAFRKPRQDFQIKLGNTVLRSFSHSSSTGFNSFPRIMKRGDFIDSGRARRYTVQIEFGLPADNVGTSFRRYSYVNVAYSPARVRTLTISGTYTAGSGATARANYESAFAAYAASVQTSLGGVWKLLEEPQSTADDQNKEINFSATYEEIIYTRIGAGDADLRGEKFTVTRSSTAPGDSPNNGAPILRLLTISATYEAWFNKNNTLDLKGKWNGLRASAVQQMAEFFAGGSFALTAEAPLYDPVRNHITVHLEAQGASSAGVVRYNVTSSNVESTGIVHVPVMNGRPYAKYRYQGPGTIVRTITQDWEMVGGGANPAIPAAMLVPPQGLKADIFVVQDDYTPITRGIPPFTFNSTVGRKVLRLEFYEEVAGSNSNDVPTLSADQIRSGQNPGAPVPTGPGQGNPPV